MVPYLNPDPHSFARSSDNFACESDDRLSTHNSRNLLEVKPASHHVLLTAPNEQRPCNHHNT